MAQNGPLHVEPMSSEPIPSVSSSACASVPAMVRTPNPVWFRGRLPDVPSGERADEARAPGTDVIISVACLLSVLVFLLALAVALQTLLLRMLHLEAGPPQGHNATSSRQHAARLQRQMQQRERSIRGPSDTSNSEAEENDVFPLLPSEAYLSGPRVFCVFNAGRWNQGALQRKGRRGLTYGISTFPYHLCTDAVYCCGGLDPTSLDITLDDAQPLRFAALRLKNPLVRLLSYHANSPPVLAAPTILLEGNLELSTQTAGHLLSYSNHLTTKWRTPAL